MLYVRHPYLDLFFQLFVDPVDGPRPLENGVTWGPYTWPKVNGVTGVTDPYKWSFKIFKIFRGVRRPL